MNPDTLVIERASDLEALSLFSCGVREIDFLIHKKDGGLNSFVAENNCEPFLCRVNEIVVGVFVYSLHELEIQVEDEILPGEFASSIEIDFIAIQQEYQRKGIGKRIINAIELFAKLNCCFLLSVGAFFNKRYSAVGFYEKCGFVVNGEKQSNVIPMIKKTIVLDSNSSDNRTSPASGDDSGPGQRTAGQ